MDRDAIYSAIPKILDRTRIDLRPKKRPCDAGSVGCGHLPSGPRQLADGPPDIRHHHGDARHGLGEAVVEYDRLAVGYPRLGYKVHALPKTDVKSRADIVLVRL